MAVYLPLRQESPWFEFACELEGVTYTFTLRWNDVNEAWVMDIGDGEGTLLAAGIKIVINVPLLFALRKLPGLPPGELICLDTRGTAQGELLLLDILSGLSGASFYGQPGFPDLGRRHQVVYLTTEDVAAAAAGA